MATCSSQTKSGQSMVVVEQGQGGGRFERHSQKLGDSNHQGTWSPLPEQAFLMMHDSSIFQLQKTQSRSVSSLSGTTFPLRCPNSCCLAQNIGRRPRKHDMFGEHTPDAHHAHPHSPEMASHPKQERDRETERQRDRDKEREREWAREREIFPSKTHEPVDGG